MGRLERLSLCVRLAAVVFVLEGALAPAADAASNYFTVAPCRVFDTRQPGNAPALSSGTARTIAVAGACGVPVNATSVAVNLAVTQPTALGYLRLYGSGSGPSFFSAINFAAGQTRGNNAIVGLSATGQIDALATLPASGGTVDVIIDVFGYFVDDAPPVAVADSASVTEDASATTIDVLANDTDSDGGPISVGSVAQPAHGTVAITNGGANLTYQPAADYCNTPPGTTLDTFTYTLVPGGSTATVSVTVICVNDAPVVGGEGTVTFTEDGPPVIVAAALTVQDVDNTTLQSATVMISNLLDSGFETLATDTTGTSITASYVAPNLTLSGTDTVANYQLVLRRVTYRNTSANPDSVARFVAFVANDGSLASPPAIATVLVATSNDAPVLTSGGGSPTFTEDGAPAAVDPGLGVTDPDDTNLQSATVTITNVLDAGAEALAATTAGTTITASYVAPALTLNGSDTLAHYQQVLRSVTYANSAQNPNVTARSIAFVASDGTANSNTATKTLALVAVNDAPVVTAGGGSPTFTEDGAAVAINPALTVTDADNTNLASATATITNLLNAGAETLAATTAGTSITASYVAPTLTLTGSDTLAHYEQVLRSVTYANSSQNPNATARSIAFVANDGTANSNTATKLVTITAVNDAPVLTSGGGSPTFTENGAPVAIDNGLTVTDPDNTSLQSATVTITNPLNAGAETLAASTGGTAITASYVAPTLTLTGSDTVANYQAVLRSVTYQNTSDTPNTTARSITFVASDGTANSNTATKGLAVVAVNDAPVLTASGGSPTFTEDGAAVPVDPTLAVTDVDNTNLQSATVTITNLLNAGAEALSASTGGTAIAASYVAPTLTLTGADTLANYQAVLRSVTYSNSSQNPSTTARTISFQANDGTTASNAPSKAVSVVALNDAPTLAGTGTVTFTEDAGAVAAAPALTASDPDNTNLQSATVTITNLLNPGLEVLTANTGATGIVASYTAPTLTLTGTSSIANYQAVLRTVAYNNGSNNPNPTNRALSFAASDGTATSNVVVATVGVVPVNDAPVFTTNPVTFATAGNTQLHVAGATLPGVASIADAQGLLAKSAPTDVDGPVAPAVVPASGATANSGSFTVNANGSFTYVPAAGFTGTDSFTYQVTDSQAAVTGTVNVTVSSVVWYVRDVTDANNPAGGDGRSTNAFETLVGAQGPSGNNHFIFVFEGNTATTPLGGGIVLKDGQKLHGEGVGLSVPSFANIVAAGNQPRINNAAGDAVSVPATAGNRNGVEIRGLDLQGTGNAIDVTASGTNAVGVTISSNTIRGAGQEGIDLNDGSTGLFTATVQANTIAATGNGFDARTTVAGAQLRLDFSTNTAVSNANAVVIDGSGGGTTTITGFNSNAVNGNTGGTGIAVNAATFDAIPSGTLNQVSAGATIIGASGNGVGGAGLVLTTVSGDLAFTDLDVFADGGAALRVVGTGAFTGAAGTQVSVGAGVATLTAVGGPGADLSTMTANLPVNSLSSSNSATTGVSLVNVPGTFSAPSGSSITNATGTDFAVDGSNATVSYGGTITDDVGTLVTVANTTGGIKTFSGAITDLNNGTGNGVSLTNNTSATIRFSGGLVLSTGGNPALTATGGGTVEVCDENPCAPAATGGLVNTLATTTATALNVANTTIGANNLEIRSISSNGGTDAGIVLDATGTSGGLKVKGTGAAGTGGTIANKTGANIYTVPGGVPSLGASRVGSGLVLSSTSKLDIRYMNLSGFTNPAIVAFTSSDLALSNLSITGASGDDIAIDEGAVYLYNITGTATIASCAMSGGKEDNLHVLNTSGTLNTLAITGSTFGFNDTVSGNNNILIEARNAGTTLNFTLQGSTIKGARADWLNASANSSSSMTAVVDTNTFDNIGANAHPGAAAGGNRLVFGSVGTMKVDIKNNTMKGSKGEAVFVRSTAAGAVTGFTEGYVRNNTIGDPAVANSGSDGGSGISVFGDGGSDMTIVVTGNIVRQYNNHGISMIFGDEINNGSVFAATVTANNIKNPGTINTDFNAISLNNGTVGATDDFTTCADIGSATASLRNDVQGGGKGTIFPNNADIRLRHRQTTTVRLPGYTGPAHDNTDNEVAEVETYLAGRNTVSTTAANGVSTGGGYVNTVGGAPCAQPSFP
jgi:VCBS repeat-containing protein